jgi:ubiquinone/menaquinone biosynthesis C-methylase UbiE
MTEQFYGQAYYESHFGPFLLDESYYEVKAQFWKHAICSLWSLPDSCTMLDYGCGLGQVTAAFQNCQCFDVAEFSRAFLEKKGRKFYADSNEIPLEQFDVVISSHSLEHTPDPFELLKRFRCFAKASGALVLILPIERDFRKHLEVDNNDHLFAWTFQTISNLLLASGWTPCLQEHIFDSFCLRQLSRRVNRKTAVRWSWWLGRALCSYRSMFIVAKKRAP